MPSTTLPVSDLGGKGIFTDVSPYDLPLNAFSDGKNVIFDEGRVQKSPVFKPLYSAIRTLLSYDDVTGSYDDSSYTYNNAEGGAGNASFVSSYNNGTSEVVIVCDNDGTVREYPNGSMNLVNPGSGIVTNSNPWTHCQTAGISILSRKDTRPYIRNIQTESQYGFLRNDWAVTDTCSVIRPYLDYLIALNITKNGVNYPTLVKWSNPLIFSPDPDTADIEWDYTDPTNLAGENPLGDLKTPILDGLALNNSFFIYSSDQTWLMEFTGDTDVFSFRKAFDTGGVINVNCVVEVENKHLVFGIDDIYIHDGVAPRSIADGKVRRRIYQTIDRTKLSRCFVHHDSVSNLVYFCYVSTDSNSGFKNTEYCNVAAIYNYRNDTWSFMDLPNIVGGALATLDIGTIDYTKLNKPFNLYNNSYSAFDNEIPRVSVMVGMFDTANNLTESRVYALDLPISGLVPLPVEPETLRPSYVERIGINLQKETGIPLRVYKVITTLVPQLEVSGNSSFVKFIIGSQDHANSPIIWQPTIEFDHKNTYKVDVRAGGRYLAIRIYFPDIESIRFAGYDLEGISIGRR